MKPLRLFISSVQQEFAEERTFEAVGGRITGEVGPWPDSRETTPPVIQPVKAPVTGDVAGEVTGEATGEVKRLFFVLHGEMKRTEIQQVLGLRHEDYFREAYLVPALQAGFVQMTTPDKPRSGLQRYRLTSKGKTVIS